MKIRFILLSVFICLVLITSSFSQEKRVKVVLYEITGYGVNEAFAQTAARALENVLNSEEFRDQVLKGKFNSTGGLTNRQLYDKIMTAHEEEGPGGQDGVLDLRIRTLRIDADESDWKKPCRKKTIGVDGAGTGVTAICPQKLVKWVEDKRTDYLAAHYAHEYMHILGFSHNEKPKDASFVYQIGEIVESLAAKMINISSDAPAKINLSRIFRQSVSLEPRNSERNFITPILKTNFGAYSHGTSKISSYFGLTHLQVS